MKQFQCFKRKAEQKDPFTHLISHEMKMFTDSTIYYGDDEHVLVEFTMNRIIVL